MVWERLTRKQMTSRPCEQYTHKNSTYRYVQHDHISSREHAWLKSCKAQDRTSLCRKTIVIHVSCLIRCRTWHWPQAQVLSHSPLPSFRRPHQHTQDLRYTMNIFPTMVHGRVADQRKSHVSQVMSPNSSSLKTSSPEELSLTGILGQIRIKYRKDSWGITTKTYRWRYGGIWKSWFRYVLCPITDAFRSWLSGEHCRLGSWRWRITKKCWLHHCMCKVERTVIHLEYQLHQWNFLQQYRREKWVQSVLKLTEEKSLMSSSSQERRASGKSAAMSSSGSAEPRNQFKSSIFKNADPSNVGRSLLEGIEDHLLSQARSDLAKQELQVEPLNNWSVSFSNKLMLKGWNFRTHNMDMLNLDENKCVNKKNYQWKRKFSEILDSEICTKWEKLRLRKNFE